MKNTKRIFFRIFLLLTLGLIWWFMLNASLSEVSNLIIIFGGVLVTYPLILFGRKILYRRCTADNAIRTTTWVQFGLGFTFGIPIIRATMTYPDWRGWQLPIPEDIGLVLVIITGLAFLIVVMNLALKAFGAPFFIVLSPKLAIDWCYAWTRNPMVLAAFALFVSLGVWFQSALFLLWVIVDFMPAMLFFVKVYEERELEFRFGDSYLEYKSKTPMLFPRKPGKM